MQHYQPYLLVYSNFLVLNQGLFQPEYRILKKAFEEKLPKKSIMDLFEYRDLIMKLNFSPSAVAEETAKENREKSDIECNFYESADNVPDPRDLSSKNKNLMIFDDLISDMTKDEFRILCKRSWEKITWFCSYRFNKQTT
ncbi:hypothetical protein GQR58_014043 [Nymphon striatum]|nr:hypothetical protein GQR58_014043 [Nymphon striatum]